MQDAVTAVSADGTIELTDDASAGVTQEAGITLSKSITLNLNGHTLTSEKKILFDVDKDATLTINAGASADDTTAAGKIVAQGTNSASPLTSNIDNIDNNNGLIMLDPGANLTVNNVTFEEGDSSQGTLYFNLRIDKNATEDSTYHDRVSQNAGTVNLNNVNATTSAKWIFYSPDDSSPNYDKDHANITKYEFNVTGGNYKSTYKNANSPGIVFYLAGMKAEFDGVTIETDKAACVYASGRYDQNHTSTAADNANITFKNCNFTQNGIGDNNSHAWCECLIAVSYANVAKIESGTYTFAGKAYGLYPYSSSGGFIIEGGTFNDESTTNVMLQLSAYDSNSFSSDTNGKGKYDYLGKNFANISGGTFNIGTEVTKLVVNDGGSPVNNALDVTGGRFSADISSFVANTDFAYQTSSTVGDYYYVGTKGNNWNPVSKDAADTTKAAATNTTWHYFSSSTATSPVATLEGAGSTLTLTTATGVPETFAISLQDILNGNTNGYTALDATAATVNLAIGGTSKITKITGSSHDDTLVAGSVGSFLNGYDGNDSLVGGTGKDTFSYNAGADTVSGYDGDLVVLDGFKASDATFTADSSNISLNFGANDRLIFEGVGTNAVSVQSGNNNYIYTKNYVRLNDGVTLAANYSSVPNGGVNTFDASTTSFATIDASPVTTEGGVYVSGNSLDNKIFGATAGGSLYGGTGNDLLDVNDRSTGSNFTFQYTAGADTVDGFVENNDQLSIDSALRADITSAKSSTSQLIFNFSNQSNVLTFKGDDIEKVSLTGGGFLTKDGVVSASNSLDLFATAKGRIDLTDTPYKGTDINSVNAEKARNQSVTLVGSSVGGALTLANNHKKDLFIYGGGDVSITNYENDTDKIDLENYSIKGFQIANTNDVSLNVAYGTNSQIMSIAGAAQAEVLIHDANGKNNSYNKIVFYQNGVLHNKAKRPTIATISAGASDYQADNSIKKIFVTGEASGIAITAGNNKTTLDASEAGGVSLYGGAKNDKLIGNATKADNFFYSAGKDIIEGYDTSDQISLTGDDFNIGDAKITLSKSSLKFKFSNKNTLTLKNSDLSTIKVDGEEYTFAKNAYSDGDGENVSLTSQFSGTYKIKDEDAGEITAVDGSAVKKNLTFKGSEKAETFTGGQKKTTFKGGGGADSLVGGTGKDIFFYAKGDAGTNTIQSFDFTSDRIKIANGTIKDISTTASGIQFEMTSGKRGDTATAGSFVLASSIASGGSGETADIVPSNVFIKANNTHYWFAKESGTDINGNAYAIGDLITASTKVTRAQANETGYAILDLGYSTNLAKTSVAVKASETFTFDSTDGVKKKT